MAIKCAFSSLLFVFIILSFFAQFPVVVKLKTLEKNFRTLEKNLRPRKTDIYQDVRFRSLNGKTSFLRSRNKDDFKKKQETSNILQYLQKTICVYRDINNPLLEEMNNPKTLFRKRDLARFRRSTRSENSYMMPVDILLIDTTEANSDIINWKDNEKQKVSLSSDISYYGIDMIPKQDDNRVHQSQTINFNTNPASENNPHFPNRANVYKQTKHMCEFQNKNRTKEHFNFTMAHNPQEEESKHDHGCKQEKESGLSSLWILLYIFIVFFLFVALAVVCDEFFVPSLEAISEKLNLSEDVAGATFMAAGSSAPELFTSIVGVGTGSDVGVGTIVGSAVFNLLVIIALTSGLAGRVLEIDWRPLVRDSIFYGFSILIFIFFSWDAMFYWWESLLLLLLYAVYCVTMKYNPRLMEWMGKTWWCSCLNARNRRISPESDSEIEMNKGNLPQITEQQAKNENVTCNIPLRKVEFDEKPSCSKFPNTKKNLKKSFSLENTRIQHHCCFKNRYCCCCCCCCRQQTCKAPILKSNSADFATPGCISMFDRECGLEDQMLCGECSRSECSEQIYKEFSKHEEKLDDQIPNFVPDSTKIIQEFKPEIRGCFVFHSCKSLNENLECTPPPPYDDVTCTDKGQPCYKQKRCYSLDDSNSEIDIKFLRRCQDRKWSRREAQKMNEVTEEIVTYTEKSTTNLNFESVTAATQTEKNECTIPNNSAIGEQNTPSIPDKAIDCIDNSTTEKSNTEKEEMFMVFPCLPSIRHPPPDKPDSSDCIPSAKYIGKWTLYGLSFPWVCAYTWTIPDCSKPENRKWYLISFFMSIAWIASISYIMVEVVEKVGCLLGIDVYTMGLLVISVGTSVPDAISSILVAREGYGDMAVSNAIGSNVFDINLGLGLPFLIVSLITSKPVPLLTPLQNCLLENLPLSFRIVPHVKFGLILFIILLICLAVFFAVRFRLNRAVCYIFSTMYIGFMLYAFVQEKVCYGFFC